MSVWLICAFTVERVIAVMLPHRVKSICTKRRARMTTGLILAIALTKNLSLVITRTLEADPLTNRTKCVSSDFDQYVRPWIVLATVNVIPFVLISVCNACIIRHVRRLSSSRSSCNTSQDRLQSQLGAMTRMCLSISFAFLVLISPSMILLVGRPYWTQTEISTAKYNIASTVGSLCQYTSNSINMYLYCLSGKAFRQQLAQRIGVEACHKRITQQGAKYKTQLSLVRKEDDPQEIIQTVSMKIKTNDAFIDQNL
ncbi:hypothetical protein CAPTEDRAFT_208558 [Capitella teleta]|uniref:G-protein coupled receptors family 1 profile domain-containing protein n=1 Tax=Capitella teleta TaxID=283909 RepID=R7T3P7_CAPTE|nr:hypothetical protein CAPTEDRAFT_208558 [Capitella teleta]|eukprot:ELT87353.1 hypothetical protein CAPTEDRAFT_208558 [Capitella teleta]